MVAHLAALCLALLPALAEDPDWTIVWAELLDLEASELEGPGRAEQAQELALLGRDAEDRVRGLLLEARVERWRGGSTAAWTAALAEHSFDGLDGTEAWLLADLLEPGEARVRAAQRGLAMSPELARPDLMLAWQVGLDEALALRFEAGALPIHRALHARYDADWTAQDLCLSLSRLGRRGELDRVMPRAIDRARAAGRPTAELWAQWGVLTLGFGDTARARDYLGRGLAGGSSDAGLVLGLLELEAGHFAGARNAFRPSILSDPPSAWALRGWGLSLLPEATTLPAVLP